MSGNAKPLTRARLLALVADPEAFQRRFWSRVTQTPGCWIWSGPKSIKGYGVLKVGGSGKSGEPRTQLLAHRVAYVLRVGEIPRGMDLRTTCGRPECVRPAHLVPMARSHKPRPKAFRSERREVAA